MTASSLLEISIPCSWPSRDFTGTRKRPMTQFANTATWAGVALSWAYKFISVLSIYDLSSICHPSIIHLSIHPCIIYLSIIYTFYLSVHPCNIYHLPMY